MIECNTRTSVREEGKVSLETSLLADRKLDAFALGLFFSYPGHELPRRYCFTLVQWQKSRQPSGVESTFIFFWGENGYTEQTQL